jgi:hypothetical protein
VGGATLAAPFLSSLQRPAKAQDGAPTDPVRMVIFYTQNGCLTNRWFPSVVDGAIDATSLTGTTLEPLAQFAPKLLFPRGFGMFPKGQITVNGTSYFDPHDQGMGSKLTAAPIDSTGEHWAMGRSLDHVAADYVNQGSTGPLVLSVGNVFANVKGILSYTAANEPYTPETKPANVYSSLTGLFQGGGVTTEADYRVARGNSIIDLVRENLDSFRNQNMSANDQRRVSDWLELLHETEQQVVVSAQCNADAASSLGVTDESVSAASPGGFGGSTETAFTQGGDMMIKLIALTMMCDANRSIVMQWPGFITFDWLGHEFDHHGLSHRVGSAAVGGTCVSGVIDMLNQIDQWYAGRYTQLVSLIDSIVEGDKTMLDNSAVMWLPELADGNAHNNNNLPIVIAGGAGGYLKTGVAVNVAGGTLETGNSEASCVDGTEVSFNTGSRGGEVPLNKLYVTLLNALGARDESGPIQSFGMVDSNDIEAGITQPGEVESLKAT